MATEIQVWESTTGLADGDFSLVETVPDGAPFWAEVALPSGELAFFKVRRYDTVSDTYSAFSPTITLAGVYPGGNMNISNTTQSGFNTLVGIGIQPNAYAPVQAARLLEHVDGTMVATMERIERKTIRNHPGVAGFVLGESSVKGNIEVEITPEGFSEALCMTAGAPVTTAVAAPAVPTGLAVANVGAAGAVTAVYNIVARNARGDSAVSAAVTNTTTNAMLNGTNYNAITWDAVAGATSYVVEKGGAVLAIVSGLSYDDQGGSTTAYVVSGAPTGLAVANVGTLGAVLAVYNVIARNAQGDSPRCAFVELDTTNADLNETNYNALTWNPVQGATSYVVLKGGDLLAVVSGLSYFDQGGATTAYTAPSAPAGNVQTWNTGITSPLFATLTEKVGDVYKVTAGCWASKLAVDFDRNGKDALTAKLDVVGLWQARGLTEAQCGLDVAGFDPLGAYGPVQAVTMINGAIASCEKCTYDLDRSVGEKKILSGSTGAWGLFLQAAKHKIKATLYFDDDTAMQEYFGQVAPFEGVYGQAEVLQLGPIETVISLPVNGAGVVNQFGIYCPSACFTTVGESYKRDGAIMQDIEIVPAIDGVSGNDVVLYVVNSQSNANIVTPGTLITGVSGGAMYPYSN